MTYTIMKKLVENGIKFKNLNVEDIQNKLDVFFANDRLTAEEYEELIKAVQAYSV